MTFSNNINTNKYFYGSISTSISSDTNISSINDPPKRQNDSVDLDVVERSTKRIKTDTTTNNKQLLPSMSSQSASIYVVIPSSSLSSSTYSS
mmetsp:Transcript_3042/g.3423  ORF Transcript_3042/g.3423 Transcript_3042/m.3423 type:complete len:92 (+) Transcript_3042:60-335(+)